MWPESQILKHEAGSSFVWWYETPLCTSGLHPVYPDLAVVRRFESGDDSEQRGLAAPAWPQDHHARARRDLERDAIESLVRSKSFGDAPDGKGRGCHRPSRTEATVPRTASGAKTTLVCRRARTATSAGGAFAIKRVDANRQCGFAGRSDQDAGAKLAEREDERHDPCRSQPEPKLWQNDAPNLYATSPRRPPLPLPRGRSARSGPRRRVSARRRGQNGPDTPGSTSRLCHRWRRALPAGSTNRSARRRRWCLEPRRGRARERPLGRGSRARPRAGVAEARGHRRDPRRSYRREQQAVRDRLARARQ